ncbi:MAG: tetratricopeptide repeat protein [Desulfobacterales bacterium]|nr:tetratricopeptide repeat protein [Desulfobacterales bacterium]
MKTLRSFLLLVCLFSNISLADDAIRNLEAKLKTVSGKEKIKVLNDLAEASLETSARKSIEYGKQALELAEKTGHKKEKANAFENIGVAHNNLSDYDKALEYHINALKIREELGDKKDIANSLHYIGVVYDYLGIFEKALNFHFTALKMRKQIGDKTGIASSLHNIGIIYYLTNRPKKALDHYIRALKIGEELGDKKAVAKSLNNIGVIYKDLFNYAKSLKYYLKGLKYFEETGDIYQVANISNNIGQLYITMQKYDKAFSYLGKALKIAKKIEAKEIIRENYSFLSVLYTKKEDYKRALEYYKLSSEVKDSIFTGETNAKIADMQTQYETDKKQKEIELLKKDNEIQQLELDKQKLFKNSLFGGLAFVLILALVMYNRYRLKKRAHAELESAHDIIKLEKSKSDKLLLNILPVRVAEDLKERGKTEPESYENVTVYFSDIVGFTNISSTLEPNFLIDELNDIFTIFDNIIEKNQCERIKTIGDAYLCVCGMPMEDPNHAENIVKSSIQIIQYLKERNQYSETEWKIRIGIHTGKVVGGVVGVKKYIYDVFGDTINTASRMESNSEPMKINISEVTYKFVKDKFEFIEREPLEVKGKGEMKMYFVK